MPESLDQLAAEFAARARAGEGPSVDEYAARHPELADRIRNLFPALLLLPPPPDDTAAAASTPPDTDPDRTGPYAPKSAASAPPAAEADRYRLGEELARGGMGVVYRADDTVLKREVAVKVLSPELVGTAAARRFAVEAEITAGLQHPSIPPVHDLGTLPDGRPFLAMKLIKGQTLAKRLAARTDLADGREDLLAAFEQICNAVAFAHSRRVIHRDLKPANVMVGAFSEVQVMDWGLAKRLGQPDELGVADATAGWDGANDRTRAGAVMGTPSYMPPEQARGQTAWVDERADVFALGGILCAILTGRPPYTGRDGRDVWRKATAADLSDVLTALDAVDGAGKYPKVAKRCLEVDAGQRYAHAGEVAAAAHDARTRIETAKRRDEIHEATDEAQRTGQKDRWSRRWWQIVGLSGLAFGAIGFFWDGCLAKFGYRTSDQIQSAYDRQHLVSLLIDRTVTDVEKKTFDPEGREGLDRIRHIASDRKGRNEALLCVLLSALAEVKKDSGEAERQWQEAVNRVSNANEDAKREGLLCLWVIDVFGRRSPLTAVDRAALNRVVTILSSAKPENWPSGGWPGEIQAALDKAKSLLEKK